MRIFIYDCGPVSLVSVQPSDGADGSIIYQITGPYATEFSDDSGHYRNFFVRVKLITLRQPILRQRIFPDDQILVKKLLKKRLYVFHQIAADGVFGLRPTGQLAC